MCRIFTELGLLGCTDSCFGVATIAFATAILSWSCATNQGAFLESSIVVDSIVRVNIPAHDHPSDGSKARLVISFVDQCENDAPAGCRVDIRSTTHWIKSATRWQRYADTLLWDETPYVIELEEDSVEVDLRANFRDLVAAKKRISLKGGEIVYMSFIIGGGCGNYRQFYKRYGLP